MDGLEESRKEERVHERGGWKRVRMVCFSEVESHMALSSDNTCYCFFDAHHVFPN